jgi:hypothetical protein
MERAVVKCIALEDLQAPAFDLIESTSTKTLQSALVTRRLLNAHSTLKEYLDHHCVVTIIVVPGEEIGGIRL